MKHTGDRERSVSGAVRAIAGLAGAVLLTGTVWAQEEEKKPGEVVESTLIKGDLPATDPLSPRWQEAPVVEFPMSPQVHWDPRIFSVTVKDLTVRSLHDGRRIAFLLEYQDPTESPGDGAAIEFPVGGAKAHFAHGQPMAQVEGGKVNIWHWKAAAQRIADVNAQGFGTLAVQPQQDVTGKGVWKDGVWRVVFARDLEDDDPADVQLTPGKFVQVAFAVWNEANFERGAMKAVTSWWWFMAQPPPDRTIWIYTGLAVLGVIAVQVAVLRRVRRKR